MAKAKAALVCLNHPAEPATHRCAQCMKPICGRCAVERSGEVFCGPACADQRGEFALREQALRSQGQRERFALGPWIARGVIAVLFFLIVYYVFVYQGVRTPGDFREMLGRMF